MNVVRKIFKARMMWRYGHFRQRNPFDEIHAVVRCARFILLNKLNGGHAILAFVICHHPLNFIQLHTDTAGFQVYQFIECLCCQAVDLFFSYISASQRTPFVYLIFGVVG